MGALGRKLQQGAAGNAGGKLYLTPASGSHIIGDTITLTIKENSFGTSVNGVQANLTYSAASLQFLSASTAGSAFTTTLQNTGGSGSVQIGVGLLAGSTSGDQTVATVSFRVIGSGSTSVTFAAGSIITAASDSSDICRSKVGATLTLGNTTGPKLYLTPASGSYTVGGSIVMAIREDSLATAVNGVQADLTYPSTRLQFESANTTGSPFTMTLQNTGGGGTIQLGVGLLGSSVTGDQLVGTVTFTVLAAGVSEVAVAGTSMITAESDSSNVCQHRLSAFYNLS